MKKNYLSELHMSVNARGNPYVILNANEFDAIKDANSLSKYFNDEELERIIRESVYTRILLQDSEKMVYKAEDYCTIRNVSLFTNRRVSTYVIEFNRRLTYPIKILFQHSFRLNLYSHLKEKLKNENFRNSFGPKEDVQTLFNQVVEHEESLLKYNNTQRTTITFETRDIDITKFMDVKERVNFAGSPIQSNGLIQNYSVQEDGFTNFSSMIINNSSASIPYEDVDALVNFYTKLINVRNDYDYRRFLFTKGIYDIREEKKDSPTSPRETRTNVVNASTFSEDNIFKLEDVSLKTSTLNNSANLFIMFILNADQIVKPTTQIEKERYDLFLSNPFLYPNYFFRHVMKFKLEYLSSVDENSLFETWEEVNSNNLSQLVNQTIMCRINLKNKKYYDKLAYEYFIVGV